MEAYCAGCGTEADSLELIECVICGQTFCESCLTEGDICFACLAEEESEDEEDDAGNDEIEF